MKLEDLNQSQKIFIENIKVGHTPEYFVLGISSGSELQTYALTPAHIKRLQQYLAHEIIEYEKKHGEITAEWNPNVISPVQRANPPMEGS